MSLGGDDRSEPDIFSSMERSSDNNPSRKVFTIDKATTSVSIDGPSLEIIASFTCCDTNVGEIRISGFGLRQAEVETRDCKHVSCQTGYLVRVSAGRGDSSHEANSPFHALSKVSRSLDATAVLMMSMNKGVNEAHYHDPIVETSQEHLGDQITKWKHSSLSPERSEHVENRRHSL